MDVEGEFLIARWLQVLHRFRLAILTAALSVAAAPAAAPQTSGRPNIVIMLVDDMGWSDIGCYGGEIPHAESRRAGGQRRALHAVLQHGAVPPSRARRC